MRWPARFRAVWSALLLAVFGSAMVVPGMAPRGGAEALVSTLLPKTQLVPALSRLASGFGPPAERARSEGTGAPAAPLAALATLIAALAAVAIVASALAFGRFYCSFLCPLGALQDAVIALRRRVLPWMARRAKALPFARAPDPGAAQAAIFALAAGAALAGSPLLLGYLEPWSAFGKIASGLARPLADLAANAAASAARALGSWGLASVPVSWEASRALAGGIALLAAGGLSLCRGRLFCNLLCPAGAMLRLASRSPALGLKIRGSSCTGCGACAAACRASCIDEDGAGIDQGRCVRCLDCLAACPRGAIGFERRAREQRHARGSGAPDPGRRGFLISSFGALGAIGSRAAASKLFAARFAPIGVTILGGSAAGAALGAVAPAFRRYEATLSDRPRRPAAPPGAGTQDRFLRLCTACGACSSACPSGVLKPSLWEWGLLDPAKPYLAYDAAYCQFECDLCARACPTGALRPLGAQAKKTTRLGRSVLELELCIVVTKNTRCGACAEHCPTGAASMAVPPGGRRGLPEPAIDETLCIGCGACETVCPSKPKKAIYVEGRAVQDRARTLELRPGDRGDVQGRAAGQEAFPF